MRVRWSLLTAAAFFAMATAAAAAPQSCPGALADYRGYRVISVDVRSTIGFMTPFSPEIAAVEHTLEARLNQPFDLTTFNRDHSFVTDYLRSAASRSNQRLKVVVVTGDISDCDVTQSTLRIVYTAFTSTFIGGLIPTFDDVVSESTHPVTTVVEKTADARIAAAPKLAYNATRGGFGGASINFDGLVHVDGEALLSNDSATSHLNVSGTLGAVPHLWKDASIAGALEYSDVPTATSTSHKSLYSARLTASTKELDRNHFIARYGGSIEGGSYGSVKLYAGLSGRPHPGAFSISYGYQRGSAFEKHLIDAGFITRINSALGGDTGPFTGPLSGSVHRYLDIETRVTTGTLTGAENAPTAERFLGGNEVRPFVTDPLWTIQSDAFIRSVPENSLGTGDRFYSTNITAAWPLWGRPFLPKELATDDAFVPRLNLGFETIVNTLADRYKANDPQLAARIASLMTEAETLRPTLDRLADMLARMPSAAATADLRRVNRALKQMADTRDPTIAPVLVNYQLPKLRADVQLLERQFPTAGFDVVATTLAGAETALKNRFAELDSPEYVERARRDLAVAHSVLDSFLHELNIYAISPVALFDLARIWPDAGGTQYAVGGGLRFSLVNTNLTVAYAFNPQHDASHPPGALFVKFDVTSLFR